MRKTLQLLVLLLTGFIFAPKIALGDGMVIRPDPFLDRWDYSNERNQQAFINYDSGLQKMIISIGIEASSSNAVWLFPVPASPDKVAIDVVKTLPQLNGEEITKGAEANLEDIEDFLQLTQIYTIPFFMHASLVPSTGIDYSTASKPEIIESTAQDVTVYEHLEKAGITSEIVTAKTASGLYDYLKSKNLKIESGAIPVLDAYIGKDYSFIVSWITEPSQEINGQRGVFVTFETAEIYFPLLPTSVYGSKTVPATIRVIGHVSPKIFQSIRSYAKTEYFVGSSLPNAGEFKSFYNGRSGGVKYTKIEITAPSKFLTDDLWISQQAPLKTYYTSFLAQHPKTSGIILLVLISMITGILAGLIIFRDLRRNPLRLGLIGLSNCLSIWGLVITTKMARTKNEDGLAEPLLGQIKQKGYFGKRKVAAVLIFAPILLFFFDVVVLSDFMRDLSYSRTGSFFRSEFFISFLLIYILPITSLIIGLSIKKIKKEDKDLFRQLKLAGFSTWSFHKKDMIKIAFVPIFSVLFLVISWLLVKLITLSV